MVVPLRFSQNLYPVRPDGNRIPFLRPLRIYTEFYVSTFLPLMDYSVQFFLQPLAKIILRAKHHFLPNIPPVEIHGLLTETQLLCDLLADKTLHDIPGHLHLLLGQLPGKTWFLLIEAIDQAIDLLFNPLIIPRVQKMGKGLFHCSCLI